LSLVKFFDGVLAEESKKNVIASVAFGLPLEAPMLLVLNGGRYLARASREE
jgi:hypothetical protein